MASCKLIPKGSVDIKQEADIDVFDVVWNLLNERRDLLYELLDALKSIEDQQEQSSDTKNEELRIDTSDLEAFLDKILSIDPRLSNFEPEVLVNALIKVESKPPPPRPCHFENVMLERLSDGVTLKNHVKVSLIFSYLDADSLVALSLASKSSFHAVRAHINKQLFSLPFNNEGVSTNIVFWQQIVEFFFMEAGKVNPIDRLNYGPLSKQMNAVKSLFPIPGDCMRSHTYVTLDSIKPHYIVYCDHEKPMAHTCSSANALDWENKATTKVISCSEFLKEYLQRLQVRDDHCIWGFNPKGLSPKYLCLLLKSYLDTIANCIRHHEGVIEFRKTEFIANAKHSIVHRIWIQVSIKWDFRFDPQPQNTLYLTLADHFKLVV